MTSSTDSAPSLSLALPLPVLFREALDELQHAAVGHQVQRALALVVGVADVGALLRQETGNGSADAQLRVSQKPRGAELKRRGGREGGVRGYLQGVWVWACVCACVRANVGQVARMSFSAAVIVWVQTDEDVPSERDFQSSCCRCRQAWMQTNSFKKLKYQLICHVTKLQSANQSARYHYPKNCTTSKYCNKNSIETPTLQNGRKVLTLSSDVDQMYQYRGMSKNCHGNTFFIQFFFLVFFFTCRFV